MGTMNIDDVFSGRLQWAVIQGDCIAHMAAMPDKSVDHVITDPPYEAEAHTLQRRSKRGGGIYVAPVGFDSMTESGRTDTALALARLSRGWTLVFCQAEAIYLWRRELENAGASWRRPMVWIKPDGQPQLTGDRPGMGYESIAAAWAGTEKSSWNGGGKHGVYTFGKSDVGGQAHVHPTQKPVALMSTLIRDFTSPGDIILDPYCGSGSTGVAAVRMGRRFIGFELNAGYAATARRRLDEAREQFSFFFPGVPI